MCVTTPSTWPWIDHLVSGLRPTTESLCSNSLSLRLPYTVKLAIERKSLTHYAKGTQSPLARLLLFVCMRFQDLFHSLPGFFLPFLHSTGSLSVDHEYLALEDGPPVFRQDVTCPALLVVFLVPYVDFPYGLSPSIAELSRSFRYRSHYQTQASPISLAATFGISVDFFSCGYLDVSVHRVRLHNLCIQL